MKIDRKNYNKICSEPYGTSARWQYSHCALNYLFSLKFSGSFILRIDDTDTQRSKEEYTNQIIEDLNWLGVKVDKIFKQSERLEIYNKYFQVKYLAK